MTPIIDDLTNLPILDSGQIRAYIADLEAAMVSLKDELASRKDQEVALLRENIARQAAELGIDPHELIADPKTRWPRIPKSREERGLGFLGTKKTRAPGVPKYRNPSDPNQIWTGRGKRPTWLVQLVEAGTTLESLLINPNKRSTQC